MTVGRLLELWTYDLLNTKQQWYVLDWDFWRSWYGEKYRLHEMYPLMLGFKSALKSEYSGQETNFPTSCGFPSWRHVTYKVRCSFQLYDLSLCCIGGVFTARSSFHYPRRKSVTYIPFCFSLPVLSLQRYWFAFTMRFCCCSWTLTFLSCTLNIKRDRQCTYKCNMEARSRNHCCRGKTISVTYSWVCVCSLRYPECKAHVSYYIACLPVQYLSTLSGIGHDFRKKKKKSWKIKCVMIFATKFVWNIFHSKKNWARCYHKCT